MATERLLKPNAVFTGTFTNVSADGFVTLSGPGQSGELVDIGDVDWERIVIDWDVTALSGTNTIGKLKTANVKTGTAVAAATMDAKDGGGTAIVTTTRTGAGRELVVIGRKNADADGPGVSNVGRFIGFYLDTTSITDLDGTVTIYVGQ